MRHLHTTRPTRLLVAEDDPAARAMLEALLTDADGLEVVASVADAEQAIAAASAQRPDVCVLDVTMPGGGGPHAARKIREACPAARLVALSGRRDRAVDLRSGAGSGATARPSFRHPSEARGTASSGIHPFRPFDVFIGRYSSDGHRSTSPCS